MRKKKTAGGVGKGEGKCVAGRRAAGAACMQSSNVMEDISCRTADPEELIYPRQTEIKLFVRKDIIDILKGSEHKTAAPPSPSLARARLKSGIGSRDIQMNQYIACFSFLKLISLSFSFSRPPFSITSLLSPLLQGAQLFSHICPSWSRILKNNLAPSGPAFLMRLTLILSLLLNFYSVGFDRD